MEEKMKSKIEKLGHFLIPCSTDEGVVNVLQRISEKVDELVEVYNSQSQPEEKRDKFRVELSEGVKKWMYEDTPEEWAEGLRKLMSTWGKVYFVNKGRIGTGMQTDMYKRFYDFVQSLLDDRERKVLDTVLGELPEGVIKELKLGGHPDPIGRDGFPGNFDGNYEKLYEGIVDRLEEVQTKYANLIYSIKKGIDKLNSKKKC